MAGIAGFVEDAVAALVTQEGHNRISRTDNRLEALLQGVVNKAID